MIHTTTSSTHIVSNRKWALVTIVASLVLLQLLDQLQLGYAFPTANTPAVTARINRQSFELRAAQDNNHNSASRRTFLGKTTAAAGLPLLLLLGTPQTAHADPSLLSSLQGPVQDAIAPGHWIGQFLGLNSRQVTWDFPTASPSQVSQALVNVLNNLSKEERAKLLIPEFTIATADATKVHVRTWTKNEWLDSLDVSLRPLSEGGGCSAKASFYATGFLPTSIPGAPLVNIGFAWFPFASPGPRGKMLQDYRLQQLEGLLRAKLA